MEDKEKLFALKYTEIFESVQRENQDKRRELAEQFGQRGMLQSGPFTGAISDLELDCLKKLLEAYLQFLLEVFFKKYKPWTNNDEIFLMKKIDELFKARLNASQESLKEYFEQRGLRPGLRTSPGIFERKAISILSAIRRKVQITILENRISYPELPDKEIEELLLMDEDNTIEFKSTFQWDVDKQCKNERLRLMTIKTIAAFNNTDGGCLLIGVDDKKNLFGLENDYSLLSRKNRDGFSQLITQEIENRISRDFLPKVGVSYYQNHGKDICMIKINPGDDGVWIKEGSKEYFYIRAQNSTRMLSPRESAEYIRRKWKPKE